MPFNLRVQHESMLKITVEGLFSLPVILVAPDGVIQDKSANDPTDDLSGQVLFDYKKFDPETGAEVIVNSPVVTLRRTSLNRIPVAGETWKIKMPVVPDPNGVKETFIVKGRPPEGGRSLGIIRLYPSKPVQS